MLALLAADVATYSALRSFLYERVDASLDTANAALEGSHGPLVETAVDRLAPGTFVEVRGPADAVEVTVTPLQAGRRLTPKLPAHIGGLTADSSGELRIFFTVGSMEPGGPEFRVRASTLGDGTQLIVAVSLHDTVLTLRQLLAIELAVTGVALVAAAGLGWWLVQVGLRPLADV